MSFKIGDRVVVLKTTSKGLPIGTRFVIETIDESPYYATVLFGKNLYTGAYSSEVRLCRIYYSKVLRAIRHE